MMFCTSSIMSNSDYVELFFVSRESSREPENTVKMFHNWSIPGHIINGWMRGVIVQIFQKSSYTFTQRTCITKQICCFIFLNRPLPFRETSSMLLFFFHESWICTIMCAFAFCWSKLCSGKHDYSDTETINLSSPSFFDISLFKGRRIPLPPPP